MNAHNVWQAIGPGVDDRLDELETQLTKLSAAHEEAERELGAARQEVARLEAELENAERDAALARAEGRRAKDPAKLLDELEKARGQVPPLVQRVTGRAQAVSAKRDELETYVVGEVDRLVDQLCPGAREAVQGVEEALEALRAAINGWNTVARQSVRLISKVQGRDGRDVPELGPALLALLRDDPEIPAPLPRALCRTYAMVTLPANSPVMEIGGGVNESNRWPD